MDPVNLETLVAVLLAMALGAAIGLERELADKSAGLRTNMLVAGAAAFLVTLGEAVVAHYRSELGSSGSLSSGLLRVDTIRIIEAVVTGVSVIGAGTILRRDSKLEVEGLTTAATLLFAASLGIAVAVGERGVAVVLTVVVLLTLRAVAWLKRLF